MPINQDVRKKRIYKTWVNKIDKNKLYGLLYKVEDSLLRISDYRSLQTLARSDRDNTIQFDINQFMYQDVYAQEIEIIKFRNKGNKKRGFLIGTGLGVLTGIVIGFVEGDDPPPDPSQGYWFNFSWGPSTTEEKATLYGLGLGLLGLGIGGIVGSTKIKIPINGNVRWFKSNLPSLKKYAYKN